MRSKVFKIATALLTGLLSVAGNAQQPAKRAVLIDGDKPTVKVLVECTTTVETTECTEVAKQPKAKAKLAMALPPAPPAALAALAALDAERSVAHLEKLKAIRLERAQERLQLRKRAIDPDSPGNTEVADMPPVAYGFREQPALDGPLPALQEAPLYLQQKEYSKTYSVDANDKLVINNIFGNVTVRTWNRDEFKVNVIVKVAAKEGEVLISDTKVNNMVSFTTKISQRNRTIFSKGTNNIVVNYTVYMPTKNTLEIHNKFGQITLPDFDGRVVISSEYGGLTAKTLRSTGNIINVSYGNAHIESLRESDLNAEYGSLVLLSADNLNANINYSTARIGRINYSGTINTKYGGGLAIGDVSKSLKNLTINSKYTDVKLGVNNSENANFDVTIRNGNFNYDKKANIYIATKDTNDNKNKWSAVQNYKGQVGKGSTSKMIFINSSYSTVKFDE